VQRGKTVLVVRGIPARVCRTCGEKYYSDEASVTLMKMIEAAAKAGIETAFPVYAES
jgi:hypothetical protein